MTQFPIAPPRRMVGLTVDGESVRALEGMTILDALRKQGKDTPTLCYLENLTPVNACRVCVVEVEGARPLVPSGPYNGRAPLFSCGWDFQWRG